MTDSLQTPLFQCYNEYSKEILIEDGGIHMEYFYYTEAELQTYLFAEGTFYESYNFLGAHHVEKDGKSAVAFTVYAPHAKQVFLVGDFNHYNDHSLEMLRIKQSGFFNIVVYDVVDLQTYKYRIITQNDEVRMKADPYAFYSEVRPNSASKVFNLDGYKWNDHSWQKSLKTYDTHKMPLSIYEVNLLSWKHGEDGQILSYKELANQLVSYVKRMNFTHVEFMPIMEHPFDGSWGYQLTGYFAPTSRYGDPHDLMYLIDKFHQNNIGVILDFVPVHFCKDDHGLANFDGTPIFESSNPELANNEGWGTLNFDFSKKEVWSFLISNALYWFDHYHVDGLRIDAVANMLYLNFTGKDLRNKDGGVENLDAIAFIKALNHEVKKRFPHALMIAEDSTAWPDVTSDKDQGLGFTYKWNMGFMHDVLKYMELDPLYRKGSHHNLTFGLTYAFNESFVLPFSHDEVVHGKKSMLDKMFGDYEMKFSSIRLLYMFMYMHPGKKLLFMGSEFGQFIEWDEWKELDWFLKEYPSHLKLSNYVVELNKLYKNEKALYELDNQWSGFKWIDVDNSDESVVSFKRISDDGEEVIGIFNFTPVNRTNYPIGIEEGGVYSTLMNSDHARYGGNLKRVKSYKSREVPVFGMEHRIEVDLPGLSGIILKRRSD